MDLTHRFSVPADLDTTWAHFEDIAGLAGCFPGATVTSVEGESFEGSVKVKLGPIALVYNGSGTFVDKDDAAHSFQVDAKGKDKRGNGTAGAKVTLSMSAGAEGGTDVEVLTDLAITGKPAQFGRGVMQDVSDKLLGQFVACLEQQLSAADAEPADAEPAEDEPADVEPVGTPASPVVEPVRTSPTSTPEPAASAPQSDDALDLGAAVLPVLLRSYWKPALGGLGVLALLVLVLRRRGR